VREKMPGVLWVSIVALGALVLLRVWLSTRVGAFVLLDATAWAIILFGLIVGGRWAFVLAIAITVFEGILLLVRAGGLALGYWAVQAVVVLPMVAGWRYYFPERTG